MAGTHYRKSINNSWVADFETTTSGDCRVWAFGLMEIGNSDSFIYGNNIDSFLLICRDSNLSTVYFHNLKFDGEFIIHRLLTLNYIHVLDKKDAISRSFTTLISDTGQFYSIEVYFDVSTSKTVKTKFLDSLKIIPLSVDAIPKSFGINITKGDLDYDTPRLLNHKITDKELDYLKRDVEIMSLALNIMFSKGLCKMTVGSNALADYKSLLLPRTFSRWFPIPHYDADIRQAYKGAWTFLNPIVKDKDIGDGIVLDVNSLYPFIMKSKPMPHGEGKFFKGEYVYDKNFPLFIQMMTCQFELKEGFFPTIQLKNNLSFIPTEYISSSNNEDITLVLSSVDIELFFTHYNVYDISYLSGWKFMSSVGMFTPYIDKWVTEKIQASIEGNSGKRTISKLMLNSLYGKFAVNPVVQSKIPFLCPDTNVVKYRLGSKESREPLYIPVGIFITSYARSYTINAAQSLSHRFLYADTDSLHLSGTDVPDCIPIDNNEIGAWKLEHTFCKARYIRSKTNIEVVCDGDTESLKITCAGMPSSCYENVTWDNFKRGAIFKGKLQVSHVSGGIILKSVDFTIN